MRHTEFEYRHNNEQKFNKCAEIKKEEFFIGKREEAS
jgi:hypothetical protein